MGSFLKKNYLIIPVLILSVLFALFFSSAHVRFASTASILSAKQLIDTYSDRGSILGLSSEDKKNLISKIDQELTALASEHKPLNAEFYALKDKKTALQNNISALTNQKTALNIQLLNNQNKISNLKEKQQLLTIQYQNKLKLCGSVPVAQRQNCRTQAQDINTSIVNTRNQISHVQLAIRNIQTNSSDVQSKINNLVAEMGLLDKEILKKESEMTEISDLITELSQLKKIIYGPGNQSPENVIGCTDPTASNWNSSANKDDGSCRFDDKGCTDQNALNFSTNAKEDDGSCVYKPVSCSCVDNSDPHSGQTRPRKEVEEWTKVHVNITDFGGPNDPDMPPDEELFIPGTYARDLNPNDIYTAWPLPGINEDASDPNDEIMDLPNVEECFFGSKEETWNGERNGTTNAALKYDYYAQISHTATSTGVKTTLTEVKIEDRGPHAPHRWDASTGMWRALGLGELLANNKPNHPDYMVDLEVRLVKRETGICPSPEDNL